MTLRSLTRLSSPVFVFWTLLPLVAADSAPVLAQDVVDLVIRRVEVETTKANGEAWDAFNGKPDLMVTVASGRKRYTSSVAMNVFEHDFNAKALRVRAGAVVEFAVFDQDVAVDDEIGAFTATITAADIAKGSVTFPGIGRVKQLVVELRR
jgi:hypothetical protein